MLKFIVKYRFVVVLTLLFILFLPQVLGRAPAGNNDAIITAIAVDKEGAQYEVSLQYLVATAGEQYKQRFDTIDDKAENITAALSKLSLKLGKKIGLSHCQEVIVSRNVAEDNLIKVYDFCTRFKLDTNGMYLIYTPDSAKEYIKASTDKQNSIFLKAGYEDNFAERNLQGRQTTLSDFYKGSFSPAKTAVMALIDLKESDELQSGGAGGEQGSEGKPPQKTIENNGKSAIFKNGKLLIELAREQSEAFNWFNSQTREGLISVSNVNGGQYNNALVGVEIQNKKNFSKVRFERGMPIYDLEIELSARVANVQQDKITADNYDVLKSGIDKILKSALINHIKTQVEDAVSLAKTNNFDCINVYESFYKFKNKEFKRYLNTLSDDNYLKDVKFNVNITVKDLL